MSSQDKNEPTHFDLMVAVPVWKDHKVVEVVYYEVPATAILKEVHLVGRRPFPEALSAGDALKPWHDLVEPGVHMAHKPYTEGDKVVCGTFLVNLTPFRPRPTRTDLKDK